MRLKMNCPFHNGWEL